MGKRSFRIGLGVAVAAVGMGSGAFLALPAHADGSTCTNVGGTDVCVYSLTNSSDVILGAWAGPDDGSGQPSSYSGAVLACTNNILAIGTIANSAVSPVIITPPIAGLTC
jgi:hypothetical protein